jgi:hypothetical protein
MDKIIRDVRDIERADRHALEHVIGQGLSENQKIIITIVNSGVSSPPDEEPASGEAPSAEETGPSAQQSGDQIPDCWKVYEGLSDEEVDCLDKAIRERANLTRHFE